MRRRYSRGFSLLELLVVVAIIGIFVGVAVLSVDIAGPDRETERETGRLMNVIDLLREEAMLQSRDYGLFFTEHTYQFYIFDYAQLVWYEATDDRLLGVHELAEPLMLSLRVEDRDVDLDQDPEDTEGETPQPQVLILSTGEMTPFEAELFRSFDGGRHRLSAEFDGSMEIVADGY